MDIINLISSAFEILKAIRTFQKQDFFDQQGRLAKNYGSFIAVFVSTLRPEVASQYKRLELDILRGSDQNALIFRQSITEECNITAVVVSPFPSTIPAEEHTEEKG